MRTATPASASARPPVAVVVRGSAAAPPPPPCLRGRPATAAPALPIYASLPFPSLRCPKTAAAASSIVPRSHHAALLARWGGGEDIKCVAGRLYAHVQWAKGALGRATPAVAAAGGNRGRGAPPLLSSILPRKSMRRLRRRLALLHEHDASLTDWPPTGAVAAARQRWMSWWTGAGGALAAEAAARRRGRGCPSRTAQRVTFYAALHPQRAIKSIIQPRRADHLYAVELFSNAPLMARLGRLDMFKIKQKTAVFHRINRRYFILLWISGLAYVA